MSEVNSPERLRTGLVGASHELAQRVAELRPLADDRPLELRQCIDTICEFASDLRSTAEEVLLVPDWLMKRALETITHHVRNRLNRVQLACQDLTLLDDALYFQALENPLKDIQSAAKSCLQELATWTNSHPRIVSKAPMPPPPLAEGSDTLILVVEDDTDSAELISRLLVRDRHQVDRVDNGEDALERLKLRSYDCVLLDHHLGTQMDGLAVLQAIRSDPKTKSIPVVMASGVDDMQQVVKCIEAGADDFLLKPIDATLLRAKLKSILQKRREQLRELEQFFPPRVARQYRDNKEEAYKPQQKELITTLFCDIRQFSTISERIRRQNDPALSIGWINDIMETMSECVLKYGGVIVDFVGDELFAMWGAPDDQPNQADLARTAALEMLGSLPALNERWHGKLGQEIRVGIGIHSGPALVGNSGTRRKPKYGPMGDTVNQGSRTQGASKYLKSSLVVTEAALTHMSDHQFFQQRRLCKVKFVGIDQPIGLYELVPRTDSAEAQQQRIRFEVALELFEKAKTDAGLSNADLRKSASMLGELLRESDHDGPEVALLARVTESLVTPSKWSEVFELPGK